MAQPMPLSMGGFSRGMIQDLPRAELPADAAWNMVDFVPNLGDELRGRGGWAHAVSAMSGSYVLAVADANFSTGAQLVAITDSSAGGPRLYALAATAAGVLAVSAAAAPPQCVQRPVMHQDKLILTNHNGGSNVKYWDGTTVTAITAAPTGKYAAVYKDRTWIAGSTAQPTYVYASSASNPLAWDTTNSWFSFSQPVTGLAALPTVILIFMAKRTGRLRGSTPPTQAGGTGDMVQDDPLFNVGCTDARSIAVNGSYCIFANPTGVFRTNGANIPEDLTASCGLKRYWQGLFTSYAASTWTLAGGIYQGRYYISVMNASSFVDAFCFDPEARTCWRISNLKATCFAQATHLQEELYFGLRSACRVGTISPLWQPAAAYKNDADGTAVTPVLETPFYYATIFYRHRYFPDPIPSKKTWRAVYLDYDLRDAASDNPTLTLSYIKNIGDSYTALSPVFAETTNRSFARRNLNFSSNGVGFKIAQTNASSDTRVTKLAAVMHAREESRVG